MSDDSMACFQLVASWIKKVGGARDCNFLTDTTYFRQSSDIQQQICNAGDRGCSKFHFWPPIFSKSVF